MFGHAENTATKPKVRVGGIEVEDKMVVGEIVILHANIAVRHGIEKANNTE